MHKLSRIYSSSQVIWSNSVSILNGYLRRCRVCPARYGSTYLSVAVTDGQCMEAQCDCSKGNRLPLFALPVRYVLLGSILLLIQPIYQDFDQLVTVFVTTDGRQKESDR